MKESSFWAADLFPTLFSDAFSLLAGADLSLAAAYDYYAGVGGLSPDMPSAYLAAF